VQNGGKVATYPVSTSMFGLGDSWGRMTTPLGYLAIEKKIGDNVPVGAVFHNQRLTGEVLQPNAPGRDPVTTRISWLRGLEPQNEMQDRDRLPKVAKAPRVLATNRVVAASALAAPPQHLTQPQAQTATQNQDQAGPTESAGTPTVEEMRMGGALAAERRKTKL